MKMLNTHGVDLAGRAAKAGIGYGTSYMLAKHCHGKDAKSKRTVGIMAVVGKVLPAIASLYDVDGVLGAAAGGLDAVGQASVDFLGVSHGLAAVRKEKGVRPILVPNSFEVKSLPAGSVSSAEWVGDEYQTEVLGALGQAQDGKTMTLDQLRELQSYR
jgi:hypothetical protein